MILALNFKLLRVFNGSYDKSNADFFLTCLIGGISFTKKKYSSNDHYAQVYKCSHNHHKGLLDQNVTIFKP